MNNQSLPWFRMYTDFLNDPKMIALAFEDQRHFIGILALKSDGALDQDCCPDLMDRIVAQRLWIDHAIIRDVKKRLIAAGLIDEFWQPLAWNKRQMRSDADPTNAERQRRYREKRKAEQEAKKREKELAKKAEKESNALRNAPVTQLDKDTDTDIDTDINKKTNKKSSVENVDVCVVENEEASKAVENHSTAKPKAAITTYCRSEGINATPNAKLEKLIGAGAEMIHFVEAVGIAKERGNSRWPYVLGIVENLLTEAAKPPVVNQTQSRGRGGFDPLAYVNRNRIRPGDDDVIDV